MTSLLFWNIGYARGYTGRMREYFLNPLPLFKHNPQSEEQIFAGLESIVEMHQPDFILLTEVKTGRQFARLSERLQLSHHASQADSKYHPKSMLGLLPFHRGNAHGALMTTRIPIQQWHLRHGSKRLVYEFRLSSGILVLMCHLSLRKETRARQFSELKHHLRDESRVILCGDMNTFGGIPEITSLLNGSRLELLPTPATFPTCAPNQILDLCLATPNTRAKAVTLLTPGSDHLPILITFPDDTPEISV